jgi:hypothetical protein
MPVEGVNAFPLCWPDGWARMTRRAVSNYEATEFGKNRDLVLRSLLHLAPRRDIVLSTNVPLNSNGLPYAQTPQRLDDPGVAVYWVRKDKPQVIACDRWVKVGENMRAIWYALESLRQLDRCGASQVIERAYAGFAALPAAHRKKTWREVLGFGDGPVCFDEVQRRYRELATIHHPDHGGDTQTMTEINNAVAEARKECG